MIVRQRPEIDDLIGMEIPEVAGLAGHPEMVQLMIVAGIAGGRSRVIIVGDGREIAGVRAASIDFAPVSKLPVARIELIDFETTTQRRAR